MSNYKLTLDYQLTPGWLQPYTEGLSQGQAISWCCSACERTSFPPVRTCTCGQTNGAWITLAGTARVIHYTFGQDGEFALARFDGADTSAVVKLCISDSAINLSHQTGISVNLTGRLQKSNSAMPELVLQLDTIGQTS